MLFREGSPKEFDTNDIAMAGVWNLLRAGKFNSVIAVTALSRLDVTWSNPIRPQTIDAADFKQKVLIAVDWVADAEVLSNRNRFSNLDVESTRIEVFSCGLSERRGELSHTSPKMTASSLNRSLNANHPNRLPHRRSPFF